IVLFFWSSLCSVRAAREVISQLVSATTEESQEEEEQIDEIQVERQGTDDCVRTCLTSRRSERHRLQALRIISGEARKHDDPDKRNHELQAIVVPEDPDNRGQHDTDEPHEEKLPEARETATRDGAVESQGAEHPGGDHKRRGDRCSSEGEQNERNR